MPNTFGNTPVSPGKMNRDRMGPARADILQLFANTALLGLQGWNYEMEYCASRINDRKLDFAR